MIAWLVVITLVLIIGAAIVLVAAEPPYVARRLTRRASDHECEAMRLRRVSSLLEVDASGQWWCEDSSGRYRIKQCPWCRALLGRAHMRSLP